ncbi:DUF1080 domain-containing protein [Aliifodinibius sp. S!AR15-10]|uniref:3-keto-disaccharide hydrolase n=1 Tax=Aliifodinibius sp. S!AR15-10 TaxID=2950437 RepID=UPI00285EADAC|nr:DUF1080 domain-containing protein [Aliifodinibius sp. S!AR15-10]MDR8393314.1 DUF1080 domain-containing protein [Aliifodinibius sp. S!AR15-10]
MKYSKSILLLVLLLLPVQLLAQDGWQQLFNGNNLDGWTQLNGEAEYRVEDGAIVGRAVPNTPNSFLTTEQDYGDFILEFEVFMDTQMNTGVQIRSLSTSSYMDGRVHGYQVELDPSRRAWSGGIYDEARRGWLYPLSSNPKARSALQLGQWNTVRIEAVGSSINTWINGVQCARLADEETSEGFIGLQVHSIGDESLAGAEVKWRDLRIMTSNLEQHRRTPDPQVRQISYLKNELTEWEKSHGWQLLWDGKTSDGWRGAKLDRFPESGWVMNDGVLTIQATDGGEATGPGDIVTTDLYSDFELELEFKITEGANSGIKYFVDPDLNKGPGSAIGNEFQILDDQRHPDAKMGVAGNRTVASLYDLIPATNLEYPYRGKPFNGVGEWNKARIVSKDGHVEHWLNNVKVVEYDRFSQMFAALVAYSKYQKWEDFGRWPQGHILLQDHGNEVHYRSIKARKL